MKLIITKILLIFILYSSIALSQPLQYSKSSYLYDSTINSTRDIYKNAKVKTQTEWYIGQEDDKIKGIISAFDMNGQLIKLENWGYGELESVRTYEYDKAGNITGFIDKSYNADTIDYYTSCKYTFDNLNRRVSTRYSDRYRNEYLTEYEYNDGANSFSAYRSEKFRNFTNTSIYSFNSNGYIDKYTESNELYHIYEYYNDSMKITGYRNDTINDKETFYFDANNNLIEEKQTYPANKWITHMKYKYDSKNLETDRIFIDSGGNEDLSYQWKYDVKGNKVTEYYFRKDKSPEMRVYKYNSNGLIQEIGPGDYDLNKQRTVYTYEYY